MSWVGFNWRQRPHDVYVGTRRLISVPVGVDSAGRSAPAQTWDVSGFAEALDVLDRHVLPQSKTPCRVWLSGGLSRPFLIESSDHLSGDELQRVAKALASEKTGFDEECEIWTEPRRGGGAPMAVAVPKRCLEGLLARFGQGHAPTLRSLRPWWSELLKHTLRQDSAARALAVQDCDSLTVLSGGLGLFGIARTFDAVYDAPTAEAVMMRCAVSMNIEGMPDRRTILKAAATPKDSSTSDDSNVMALAPFVGVAP